MSAPSNRADKGSSHMRGSMINRMGHRGSDRSNCYPGTKCSGSMTVPGAVPGGASAATARPPSVRREPVDEERSSAGSVCQVSFEHRDIER